MKSGTVQLRRLFRVVNGGTPTSDPGNWGGDVQWFTPEDLGSATGRHLTVSRRTVTAGGQRAAAPSVPQGSLLLSTRAPIGHLGIVGTPASFNQGCRALVPQVELDSRYFYWHLVASRDALNAAGQGSTFVELSGAALAAFRVRVPSPDEQRRIADFLDEETARIDDAVSRAESLRTLIDERTASVRERLLGEVPVAMLVPLRRVATVQTGLTLNAAKNSGAIEGRPYLRVANVQPGALALDTVKNVPVSDEQIHRHTLRYGDVLMTEGGDRDKLGRGVVWRGEVPGALHQNHVFAVRPDTRKLLPEYLEIVLAGSRARRYFESTANQTTNLASTNTTIVGAFDVPRPSIPDQQRIVRQFSAAERRHASLTSAATRQITLLRERRQALITAAVTGKLDVG